MVLLNAVFIDVFFVKKDTPLTPLERGSMAETFLSLLFYLLPFTFLPFTLKIPSQLPFFHRCFRSLIIHPRSPL